MNVKFRPILKSKGIPNLTLVIHPRVPEHHRRIIIHEFLSWSDTDEGKKILTEMNTSGFTSINDNEYNVVRDFLKRIKK